MSKEYLSREKLIRWAKNELEISGDDPDYGGEVLVARGLLRALDLRSIAMDVARELNRHRENGELVSEASVREALRRAEYSR